MSDDEKVGYKNPPKHSRFQPGQSGNTNGRPKGSKNKRKASYIDHVAEIILNEAHREIQVQENGETVSVEVLQAVTRSVIANAMKGVAKSQKLLFEIVNAASLHQDERRQALLEAVLVYKERCRVAYDRAAQLGQPAPDIVPHPADIVIDTETGEVSFVGPMTYAERDRELRWHIAGFEREVVYFEKRLNVAKKLKCKPETLNFYRDDLKYSREMLDKWTEIYETYQNRDKPDWTFKAL